MFLRGLSGAGLRAPQLLREQRERVVALRLFGGGRRAGAARDRLAERVLEVGEALEAEHLAQYHHYRLADHERVRDHRAAQPATHGHH